MAPAATSELKTASAQTHEQLLRQRVKEIVGAETIKSLRALDLTYTIRDSVIIHLLLWSVIAASCWLYLAYGPLALLGAPLGALLTGIAFNWINVQIHEASHGLLLPNRKWNDVYVDIVLGSWGLQDVETYRATHGMHHAHLHTHKDPDLDIYTQHTGSLRAVFHGLSRDLLLLSALKRKRDVMGFIAALGVSYPGAASYATLSKASAQLIVLGIYLYFCGVWGVLLYGGYYLYGLLGVFPALVRIRTVVQHHADELEHVDEHKPSPFISRTTVAPTLEFVLVGARMDYHFEHHLYPMLPYYNLRKLHGQLQQAGLFDEVRERGGPELRTENYLKSYANLAT